MNCPHCNFEFKVLGMHGSTTGSLPAVAPIICERCAEISLLAFGEVLKATDAQLALFETESGLVGHREDEVLNRDREESA